MIGKTILQYEIIEQIGEGGMGTVYKAKDTKLDRFVALKFLPSQLATTEDEKARFIQEAKAASAMNHPNVCTIHDIQEFEKQLFIVMEYIDGSTLRDIKETLSEKRILDIAIQVAEGLGAAHEKGIVHRDIKPENIMIRKDGIAQIMDFGLAKLYSDKNASRLTKVGTTMGTMGYMSPEQVQGLDVDHRSDIFSLGVVLYELFAGESPFKGMHETAIMYEIVNVDAPPLSTIKDGIDPELDVIILECLEKDKDERCQSAKELARNLRKSKRVSSGSKASRVFQAKSFSKETETLKSEPKNIFAKSIKHLTDNKISTTVIILLFIAVIILGLMLTGKSTSYGFNESVRFSFEIPGKSNPLLFWPNILAISPDGNSIAYTDLSSSTSIIKIRGINDFGSYTVRGTENGSGPLFADNNWLVFTNDGDDYARKIPLTGGVPENSQAQYSNGLSVGTDGAIVSVQSWGNGLVYQKHWDSPQESITEIDASRNEGAHINPYMLPGNNAAVFTIWSKDGTFDDSKIGLINFESKEKKTLSYNGVSLQGTYPKFINTSWGSFLIYCHSGNLYASSFDLSSLDVTGPGIEILKGISLNSQTGKAAYEFSNGNNGTIAYIPGGVDTAKNYFFWINKNGTEKKAFTNSGPFLSPSLFNNNKGIILLTGAAYKIGIMDFNNNKVDMIFDKGDNNLPKITPDGSQFVFVSNFETGKYNIYLSRLDGIGGAKKIVAIEGGYPFVSNISSDGKYILFSKWEKGSEIYLKDLSSKKEPELLFKSKATLREPEFSPDGKLISYISDEIDGKFKLFVSSFPIKDDKIQVSVDDGIYAYWSPDSKEIYYRDGDKIMAVKIELRPKLSVISRRLVCNSERVSFTATQSDFAVAPDGRILVMKSAIDKSKPIKVKVIVNWFAELKDKLTK